MTWRRFFFCLLFGTWLTYSFAGFILIGFAIYDGSKAGDYTGIGIGHFLVVCVSGLGLAFLGEAWEKGKH